MSRGLLCQHTGSLVVTCGLHSYSMGLVALKHVGSCFPDQWKSSSRPDPLDTGSEPVSFAWQGRFLTTEPPGKSSHFTVVIKMIYFISSISVVISMVRDLPNLHLQPEFSLDFKIIDYLNQNFSLRDLFLNYFNSDFFKPCYLFSLHPHQLGFQTRDLISLRFSCQQSLTWGKLLPFISQLREFLELFLKISLFFSSETGNILQGLPWWLRQ